MVQQHMTYTEGFKDGYKSSREDLVEALYKKAEETMDPEQSYAYTQAAELLENGDLQYGLDNSEE